MDDCQCQGSLSGVAVEPRNLQSAQGLCAQIRISSFKKSATDLSLTVIDPV